MDFLSTLEENESFSEKTIDWKGIHKIYQDACNSVYENPKFFENYVKRYETEGKDNRFYKYIHNVILPTNKLKKTNDIIKYIPNQESESVFQTSQTFYFHGLSKIGIIHILLTSFLNCKPDIKYKFSYVFTSKDSEKFKKSVYLCSQKAKELAGLKNYITDPDLVNDYVYAVQVYIHR